jgi:uncharacterized protein YutE (UPF0331/DUF86 family)
MTKNQKHAIQELTQSLLNLKETTKRLKRSFDQCQMIGIKNQYSPDEFDAFENLTSRFARTCDFLINKVYRAIDTVELEESRTLIDILNKAEKRGLVNSVQEIREIKELRNVISHEYAGAKLIEIFKAVFNHTQALFELVNQAEKYSENLYE